MKILVFGGAGYIGAHVVLKLLDSGHSVVVFDNFSTGEILNVDKRAIINEGDILSKRDLDNAFKNNKFDAVMHLCALKSPEESMTNPVLYTKVKSTNVFMFGIADKAVAIPPIFGIKRLLYFCPCWICFSLVNLVPSA